MLDSLDDSAYREWVFYGNMGNVPSTENELYCSGSRFATACRWRMLGHNLALITMRYVNLDDAILNQSTELVTLAIVDKLHGSDDHTL